MPRSTNHRIETPKKAKIKGAAEFMDAKGITYFHSDLFSFYGVNKHQGWAILNDKDDESSRRHHNRQTSLEIRGRKALLSPTQLREADRFLQDVGWDARVLSWPQLA
ncbi:hypothetical protein Ptr902_01966 [Pyrenophora tritici-repentis]|nr:hypothetical protein Ptr902_01966 [Pyrenophora tritici-repentis]